MADILIALAITAFVAFAIWVNILDRRWKRQNRPICPFCECEGCRDPDCYYQTWGL